MNSKSIISGLLCGVLAYCALNWVSPWQITRAAGASESAEGRFKIVELHPNAASEWSAVLDTKTGCVWAYSQTSSSEKSTPSYKSYADVLGSHSFSTIHYDASDYISAAFENGKLPSDYMAPAMQELGRIENLCNHSRIQALTGATHQAQ